MRGRTAVFGGAIFGATCGAAVGWWLRGPEALPQPVPPPVSATAMTAGTPVVHTVSFAPSPVPEEVPSGPHESALRAVAAYTGDGLVRCDVGDLVSEGPVAGLQHANVDARGILIGAVSEPEGQARIQLPDDLPMDAPLAVVRWRDAWPGAIGSCEVSLPERVAVTGTVVDQAGLPLDLVARASAQVGNSVDGGAPLGPDGRFLVPCWRNAPCPIAVRAAPTIGWGTFVVVVPDGPTAGISLVLDPPEPDRTMLAWVEEQIAEEAWLDGSPDPFELALADPSLTREARAVVDGWRADAAELHALNHDLRHDLLAWIAPE